MSKFDTIYLTSPNAHGDHVKEAQYLLQGHNRWNHDFNPGPMDGQYGPSTAAAARRAKWWLGYPEKGTVGQQGSSFGRFLLGYLLEKDQANFLKLPVPYQLRKANRHKQAMNWHNKAVPLAMSYNGYTESPEGSNQTIFNRWYYGANVSAAWCLIFVSYIIQHVGGPTWFKYSYVPDLVYQAGQGNNGMSYVAQSGVASGTVVTYDWDNDGVADHAEFFDTWITKGTAFWAVGGNTGHTNASNGGQVLRSERYISDVLHFIHVP